MKEQNRKTALVLEGGAFRSLFTSGVLDVFMQAGLGFDCVIGTSAGAFCGVSYLSGQKGRTAGINIGYCDDKDYISLKNRFRRGGVFNLDFLFEEPNGRWPAFDEEKYRSTQARMLVCATLCTSGKPVYFENPQGERMKVALKASSSMPVAAKVVKTWAGPCLDGGIADSIPFQKALDEGYQKVVVVKTQENNYRKKKDPTWMQMLSRVLYRRYPALYQALQTRPRRYNSQLEKLYSLEKEGRVFVIAPQKPVQVSHTEQDKQKLQQLYRAGLAEGAGQMEALQTYLAD